ncbi:hemerythrin family protein [Geotalea daltonii FRC-32]|uniref:Hemerythrin family protein n=1 Tax=Geotalea daltonii (strain DSM 22248 / JCM 15807 / FRC-32) TaxID=316067 RepID=B9LZA8_GEODF|nr:bacteriohemerythrin [Geotalea daltonii]ACM20661.1 hemerythrin family protein [Geotalea daltonii FRC-32]
MQLVKWDNTLTLGVEPFDDHHKHLVCLLNETYDLFIAGEKPSSLEEVIDELIDYATYHFSSEELWMVKLNYPKQEEHKKQHEEFSSRVVNFQRDLIQKGSTSTLEVLSFLQRWLVEHIKHSDGEYSRFIHNG